MCQKGNLFMMWISKEWLIEVMMHKRDVDFNNYKRHELIQMLSMLRLFLFDQIEERIAKDEI